MRVSHKIYKKIGDGFNQYAQVGEKPYSDESQTPSVLQSVLAIKKKHPDSFFAVSIIRDGKETFVDANGLESQGIVWI